MEWKPKKVQCKVCKDIIFSSRPKEFAFCSCFKNDDRKGIFIVQSLDYMRVGGEAKNMKWIEENE
jgi:hypothetical protein